TGNVQLAGHDLVLVEIDRNRATRPITAQPADAVAEPIKCNAKRPTQVGCPLAQIVRLSRGRDALLTRGYSVEFGVEVPRRRGPTRAWARVQHTPKNDVASEVQVVAVIERPGGPSPRIGAAVRSRGEVGVEEQRHANDKGRGQNSQQREQWLEPR